MKPLNPQIDWKNPLCKDLVAVFAINERAGSLLNLVDRTTVLSLVGSGVWTTGMFGPQLNCNGNDSGARIASPPTSFKLDKTVSILWQGAIGASPSDHSHLAGYAYVDPEANPFTSYELAVDGAAAGQLQFNFNADGNFIGTPEDSGHTFDGRTYQVLGTCITGSQKLYVNGVQTATNSQAFTNINYSTGAFGLGFYVTGIGRNTKSKADLCYVWNRVLNAQEAKLLYTNPWIIFKKRNFYQSLNAVATAVRNNFLTLLGVS